MKSNSPDAVRLSVTLLGTGTSTGVPVLGCTCHVCTSGDPRDTRLRCSAHVVVHTDDEPIHLQIDAGPDFRRQAFDNDLSRVDAVLITHHHFDHIAGLDDLRPFLFGNDIRIPVYAPEAAVSRLKAGQPYLYTEKSYPGAMKLALQTVRGPFRVQSRYDGSATVDVLPIPAWHGKMPVLGYRIGRFAYLTDINRLEDSSLELLAGIDTLILDALRYEPHETHLTINQAVELAQQIGARQTWFIHMTHTVMHAEVDAALPEGISLGYDGLTVDVG